MGKMVDLEEGLELVPKGITKLTNILEGRTEQSFTIGERVMLYTTCMVPLISKHHTQQPLDRSQVAPDLVQLFFGGLEPLERLVLLPFGFLELLFQLRSTLLDLSDRLRTPAKL
ncbi:hypothetical protein B296_00049385 [Ensete ventricosum]|uniref:Uncharacterized protein n=1 Tax=Ensete ventricosum TaxID=4639 RepID=A0A426XA85_ENSVE|nr:hypothetical protein B296_00049385 [Ensete ventricosum]